MEYLDLSDPEFNRVSSLMIDCCVLEIMKIKSYKKFNDCKTIELFHGTKQMYINNIINEGLKSSYNRVSAYGKGTYFSPNVKFSLFNYTDTGIDEMSHFFLCDVIESESKKCTKDILVCPNDNSFRIKYLINFYKNTSI